MTFSCDTCRGSIATAKQPSLRQSPFFTGGTGGAYQLRGEYLNCALLKPAMLQLS